MNRVEPATSRDVQLVGGGSPYDPFDPRARQLLETLFRPGDSIAIATKGLGENPARWNPQRARLETALPRLARSYGVLNLYFTPATFRPDTTCNGNEDVLEVTAFVLDIDFGEDGHN